LVHYILSKQHFEQATWMMQGPASGLLSFKTCDPTIDNLKTAYVPAGFLFRLFHL